MSSRKTAARVLVIDDEKGLRDMLSYTLRRMKYEVVVAEDGEKGVEAARAAEFDVVICDIMMPGMDGVAVLEILKKESPRVEVVMVTGYPTIDTSNRCTQLGAFAYLAKPYDLMALLAVIETAARKRGDFAA